MDKILQTPPELQEMLWDYYKKPMGKHTSELWRNLNGLHISKLLYYGYDKFKHTVSTYYCFSYLLKPDALQSFNLHLNFLINNLSKEEVAYARELVRTLPSTPYANQEFNLMTLLVWQYAKNQGLEKELAQLDEPSEGSPPAISIGGRLISLDIASSLLEFDTIQKNIEPGSIKNILELGAGYGRSAYIWLSLSKVQKYIIVDIPPALYISQRYLSSQFPKKNIFKYRNFKSFDEIKNEYEKADLAFLMPWQMEMLPKKSVDLVFSIDSLNEMNPETIETYFNNISKLNKNYFYAKCDTAVRKEDFPIPIEWECLIDRKCRVQIDFYELLYKLPRRN